MHKTQKAYAIAKATHQVTEQAWNDYMDQFPGIFEEGFDPEELDRICEAAPNCSETLTRLIEAEDEMVAWAMNMVRPKAQNAKHIEAIEVCTDRGMKHFKIRQELVDLAFKLK